MALKVKITKAEFDKLSDVLKAEYKENDAKDGYILDAEGVEDTGALKRAKDREAEEAKKEKKRADDLQAEIDRRDAADGGTAEEKARKAGDIATLEKSWTTKMDNEVNKVKGTLTQREQHLQKLLVHDTAMRLAQKISTKPNVLLPHILARLSADLTGDEPTTRVLDRDGKPSALTIAELEKEFVGNDDFAAIITGSKSSGGGAPGGKQNGGGAPKKFAEMTGTERAALKDSDPATYQREVDAVQKSSVKL